MTRSAFEPQGNVRLRPDRHKKLLNGYPWAHKGDLQSADPGLEPGGLVRIESSQGEFVGIGSYLPEGRFPVRLFTNRDERIDERFFLGRFESALKRRPLTEWNTDHQSCSPSVRILPSLGVHSPYSMTTPAASHTSVIPSIHSTSLPTLPTTS